MPLGTNHMTTTTGAVFLPDLWAKEIVRFFRSNLVIADKVKRYDQEVAYKGKAINVPKSSELTANDKLANTQVTLNAPLESSVTITMNKHKECSFVIEDIVKTQSQYDLFSEYTSAAAYAVKKAVDTDLANLATGFSGSAGAYNTALTTATMLTAVQTHDDNDVPLNDRCFILTPKSVADLRGIADYTRYDGTGYAGAAAYGGVGTGGKIRPSGLVGMLYNADVYMTTQVAVAGVNTSNLYIHKSALGLAMQKSPRVGSQYKQEYLGTLVTADVIYGVAEIRDEAGLELKR